MIRLTEPQIAEEELEAVCHVLRSGMLVQGEWVAKFERALETYMGIEHVVAVSSGTAALHLTMMALEVGPGMAVFVPAFTFPATANVVELVGARPVFVDVDPETYCLTPSGLAEALRAWTGSEEPQAVIPVHEFGAPCDMEGITAVAKAAGLTVIEDAACALGSRFHGRHVGTFGRAGCFSWHPRKAITTGEGGAIAVNDPDLRQRLAMLRNHGMERRPDGTVDFLMPGFNYRLTDFQAALGLTQLRRFPEHLVVRENLVTAYRRALGNASGLELPREAPGHAWQTFMVVLPEWQDRLRVMAALRKRGIESNLGAQGLHLLEYYRTRYSYNREDYPVATKLYERGLALPLYPGLSEIQVEEISAALKDLLAR